MKNTLIALVLIIAILAAGCGTAAPAGTEAPANTGAETAQPDPAVETEAPTEDIMLDWTPSYFKNQVTVTAVGDELIEATTDSEGSEDMENAMNFRILPETLIYDNQGNKLSIDDISQGSFITVYTDVYSPAPLILPPQYQANVIILEEPEAEHLVFTYVDTFIRSGERLVDAGNTLALNLSDETLIVDTGEEKMEASALDGKDLLVFYDVSTRSIPAQTSPLKVVVLGENQMALANINGE